MTIRAMKTILLALLIGFSFPTLANNCILSLQGSKLTLNALHYDKITPEVFRKAIERDLKIAKENVTAIRNSKQPPNFTNTIEALEYYNTDIKHTKTVLENYLEILQDPQYKKLFQDMVHLIDPVTNPTTSKIYFDKKIFNRVRTVNNKRLNLNLTPLQLRLVEKTYQAFIDNGIDLHPKQQAKLAAINTRIESIAQKFQANVVSHANNFPIVVTDINELKGLPENAIQTAATLAEKKGLKNTWVFPLNSASHLPIMQFAESRDLRERMARAFSRRGTIEPYNNAPLLLELVQLRQEIAGILGYKNFAEMILKKRMAKNIDTVQKFLDTLAEAYKPHAKKDYEELAAFAGHPIEPWDASYYSLKLAEKKFSYNPEELKSYFSLENVLKGAFYAAGRLYKIKFNEVKNIPTWHPDVRTFEVRDLNDNFIALFYLDLFPRDQKRDGAYSYILRPSGIFGGRTLRPHVINVLNIPPATESKPSLLTLNNVRTLFHELGHGLHEMLCNIPYPSQTGLRVAWDAIELPSQLNEKWMLDKDVLKIAAIHYKTNEPLPQEMLDNVLKASHFQVGMNGYAQISNGALDMAWYTRDTSKLKTLEDVENFEIEVLKDFTLIPKQGSVRSAAFTHIFSGSYAAGYYSYKWADALVADALELFKKNGMYDQETASRYVECILSKGASEDFDVLYKRFRGCDPDPDALLRSEGLIP